MPNLPDEYALSMFVGTTTLIIVMGCALLGLIAISVLISRIIARRATDIGEPQGRIALGKLVICAAIMLAVLISMYEALVLMPHRKTLAQRNRTAAFHRAIMSGLETYRDDYGEYPSPARPDRIMFSSGLRWHDSNAAGMLYQVLSGDGTDRIAMQGPEKDQPSDGQVSDLELQRVRRTDMPRELWRKTDTGYILVDGFGHPFQYTPPGPDTLNKNYDLWSFGGTAPPSIKIDKAVKQSTVSNLWIKNW